MKSNIGEIGRSRSGVELLMKKRSRNYPHIGRVPGVYIILNKLNGLCYVGSSKSMRGRINSHLSELNDGTHYNIYLQNDWNKYGYDSFDFIIYAYTDSDSLKKVESEAIALFQSSERAFGYNILENGYSPTWVNRAGKVTHGALEWRERNPSQWNKIKERIGEKSRAYWSSVVEPVRVVSPLGDSIRTIYSRREFARSLGVNHDRIFSLISGRTKHMNGWTLEGTKRISFFHRDGRVVHVFPAFILNRHFKGANSNSILSGTLVSSAGWSDTREKAAAINGWAKCEIRLISPTGDEVVFVSRKEAMKHTNISPSRMCMLLNGRVCNSGGWTVSPNQSSRKSFRMKRICGGSPPSRSYATSLPRVTPA